MRHSKLRQQRKNVAHGAEPWVQSARERGEPRSGERSTLLVRPISIAPGGACDTSRGSLSHGCRRGPHCIARQAGLQGRLLWAPWATIRRPADRPNAIFMAAKDLYFFAPREENRQWLHRTEFAPARLPLTAFLWLAFPQPLAPSP
jgi:hypothetical protein